MKRSRSLKRSRQSRKKSIAARSAAQLSCAPRKSLRRTLKGGVNFRSYAEATPLAKEGLKENVDSLQNVNRKMETWPWHPNVLAYDTFLDTQRCNFSTQWSLDHGQRFLVAFKQEVQDTRDPDVVGLASMSKTVFTEVLKVRRKRYGKLLEDTFLFGVMHNKNILKDGVYNPEEDSGVDYVLPFATKLKFPPINLDCSMGLEVSIRTYGIKRVLYVHHIQKNVFFPRGNKSTIRHLDQPLEHTVAPTINTLFNKGILNDDERIKENVIKMWWRLAVYFGKAKGCTHVLLSDNSEFQQGPHSFLTILVRSITGKAPLYERIDVYVDVAQEVKSANLAYDMSFRYVKRIAANGDFELHPETYFADISSSLFHSAATTYGVLRTKKWSKLVPWLDSVRAFVDAALLTDNLTFREVFQLWYTAIKGKSTAEIFPFYDVNIQNDAPRDYASKLLEDAVKSLYQAFPKQDHYQYKSFVEKTFGRGDIYFAGEIPDTFANRVSYKRLTEDMSYGDFFQTCDFIAPVQVQAEIPDVQLVEVM